MTRADFWAHSIPDAEVAFADESSAEWSVPSPFPMTSSRLRSQFEIIERTPDGIMFTLINQFPGASSVVNGSITLADQEDGQTGAHWQAEIISRSGLLKIIPESVLRGILEREFQKLWAGVRNELGK